MTTNLKDILEKHEKWINNEEGGERANLRDADLRGANLTGANLTRAYLEDANLKYANLTGANLTRADLTDADLTGANLDYSCWPLWCGSFDVKVNKRIVAQLAYHFCRLDCDDPEYQEAKKALSKIANQFHRVDECGRIEAYV